MIMIRADVGQNVSFARLKMGNVLNGLNAAGTQQVKTRYFKFLDSTKNNQGCLKNGRFVHGTKVFICERFGFGLECCRNWTDEWQKTQK